VCVGECALQWHLEHASSDPGRAAEAKSAELPPVCVEGGWKGGCFGNSVDKEGCAGTGVHVTTSVVNEWPVNLVFAGVAVVQVTATYSCYWKYACS